MIKIKKSKKTIAIVLAIVLALTCSVIIVRNNQNSVSNDKDKGTGQTLNLDPPTEEDKKRAEENKKKVVARQDIENSQSTTSSGAKKSVVPTITYSGQYGSQIEIGSYVSGIFEDGGECTATFINKGSTVTKTTIGVKGANVVNCPMIAIQDSEFVNKGQWSLTVTYQSATATGKSETKQIDVK